MPLILKNPEGKGEAGVRKECRVCGRHDLWRMCCALSELCVLIAEGRGKSESEEVESGGFSQLACGGGGTCKQGERAGNRINCCVSTSGLRVRSRAPASMMPVVR